MTTALKLGAVLSENGLTKLDVAKAVSVSRTTISLLINHNHWPSSTPMKNRLRREIPAFLKARGIDCRGLFNAEGAAKKKAPQRERAAGPGPREFATKANQEDVTMLLRKVTLTQAARRAFGFARDPFADPATPSDIYLSADMRYVRECMHERLRGSGFMAVVGESGAGKSTLREELLERVNADSQRNALVFEPMVLSMEQDDKRGRTLKSAQIAEAVMAGLAPLTPLASSIEARFRQLRQHLIESARTGNRHLLIIEEAHCLPIPTLKHLKRWLELKDGMKPLLSILLIAQPELLLRLNSQDPQVREVVQRLEIVTLPPLDTDLEGFVRHRLERAGKQIDQVLAKGALDALRTRLTSTRDRERGSMLYPLAVQNALALAMNAAAELGVPQVTADVIKEAV